MNPTRHHISPHLLARASLDAYIAAGRIAHHSGAADDHVRRITARVRELSGGTIKVPVELHDTWNGEVRAIVDTDLGYWDSIIPAADARKIRGAAC